MFCLKCGEAIPDGSSVCSKCGADLTLDKKNEKAIVYASQKDKEQSKNGLKLQPFGKAKNIIILCLVVILAILGINEIQKNNLKKELVREWMASGDSIIKVLDFSDKEVEYRLETGYAWMDTTVDNYKYKIISGNKIKLLYGTKWRTIKVEFNADKNILTVTPAITSTDDEENWFYLY